MVKVHCDKCNRKFYRTEHRYREAIKNNWKQFCSIACQAESKTKRLKRKCCNPLCAIEIISRRKVGLAFCSFSCNAIYRNAINAKPTKLVVCSSPSCNHYITNSNSKYCSKLCADTLRRGITTYSKDSLIEVIKNYFKDNSRIPTKIELGLLNRPARRFFGTWNNLIIESGFAPNPVMFSKKFIANDGHRCDSLSEKIVDDWLFARKINHTVKIKYPWNNGMSADFKVGNCWIEVFGLCGQLKRYDDLMKIKLEKVKEHNLDLISLYLSDIFPHNRLADKLSILQK